MCPGECADSARAFRSKETPPSPQNEGSERGHVAIAAIFDIHISEAEANHENTAFVAWLQGLKAQVLRVADDMTGVFQGCDAHRIQRTSRAYTVWTPERIIEA